MISENSEDLVKSVAQRAAASLANGGDDTMALAAQLGLLRHSRSVTDLFPVSENSDQIGIWERREEDGKTLFVRASGMRDQVHRWADVERIPPKGRKRRVVYLGESVARGFFFDPLYTPAQVLHDMMAPHVEDGVEVVDLSAHDLGVQELIQMLQQVSWLEPDAMVIFAGNNWAWGAIGLVTHDTVRRQFAAAALRSRGVAGLKAFLEEEFLGIIAREFQMLPGLVQSMGVPTVMVIPEFNLLDWRNEATASAPWLPADHNQQWWSCFEEAELALQQRQFVRAAELADMMLELDGGTTSQGLSILGECKIGLGLHAEARQYLEKARDARVWDPINMSPRCLSTIQEGLRRLAGDQCAVVDLPRVFAEWTGGTLPDRRLFLDYCHLTVEGIRVAMAATAEALLAGDDGGSTPSRTELFSNSDESPGADVEGIAHFSAAIHNAHWGQGEEIVRHHCMVAARSSPRACAAMAHYVVAQGRRVPPFLAESAPALFEEGGKLLSRFLIGHGTFVSFDELLLDTIVESLNQVDIDMRSKVDRIRKEEWGITVARPADLTADEYKPSFANRSWSRDEHRFYRAFTPVTRFATVCRSQHAIKFELVCRRPAEFVMADKTCRVRFNGRDLHEFELSEEWTIASFTAQSKFVHPGVNSIEIRWRVGGWAGEEALNWAAGEMEAGRFVDLVPPFGEVYALRAAVSQCG